MKKITFLITVFTLINTTAIFSQSKKQRQLISDAQKAKETLLDSDKGLQKFFDDSAGYVIFPNVGKGGFFIGGASGRGIVYDKGEAIGMAGLKKLNFGLQAGGQAIIEVIFFETNVDLDRFKEGDMQFSAEASAVAVKSGISVNAKYKDGVAVFAMPKAGLMADASVGGQRFTYEDF